MLTTYLHYTTLHYTTLHYTTLHLHYIQTYWNLLNILSDHACETIYKADKTGALIRLDLRKPWSRSRLKKEDWQQKTDRNQRTPGSRRMKVTDMWLESSFTGPNQLQLLSSSVQAFQLSWISLPSGTGKCLTSNWLDMSLVYCSISSFI